MLPVIGKAPRHAGLWFDFGHQHHGLTLGPATGRLLAEMMTGETPFADPAPFAVERLVDHSDRIRRLTGASGPSGRLRRAACRGDTVTELSKLQSGAAHEG